MPLEVCSWTAKTHAAPGTSTCRPAGASDPSVPTCRSTTLSLSSFTTANNRSLFRNRKCPGEDRDTVVPSVGDVDAVAGSIDLEMPTQIVAGEARRKGREVLTFAQASLGEIKDGERARQLADEHRERTSGMKQQMPRARARRRREFDPGLIQRAIRTQRVAEDLIAPEIDVVEGTIWREHGAMRVGRGLPVEEGAAAGVLAHNGRTGGEPRLPHLGKHQGAAGRVG